MKITEFFKFEIDDWAKKIMAHWPGVSGFLLRRWLVRLGSHSVMGKVNIGFGVDLRGLRNMDFGSGINVGDRGVLSATCGHLCIGSDFSTNFNVMIVADFGEIVIGDQVLIGMNSVLRAANHATSRSPELPIREQGHISGQILIGNDVWIGANVCVLPGAKIGNHCVIGAGAVVNSQIPDYSVAVGAPARVIRAIGSQN